MVELDPEKEVQTDLLTAKFSNIIIDAATSSLKFKLFKPKDKRRRKQIWFDHNCLFLQRELRKLGRRIQSNPDNHDQKVTSFQLRKRYKKLIKQKKKDFMHTLLTQLSDMNEKDPKAFWKTLDKVKHLDVKENNPINLHAWQEYFKSLLNSDEGITDMTVNQNSDRDSTPDTYNDQDLNKVKR